MTAPASNVDATELARFNALASRWWDPQAEMRLLHLMNPVRLSFIRERAPLAGARCVDIGCGGGILCESLAREAAEVTGIDLAGDSLTVARLHQRESGLGRLAYRQISAEELAGESAGQFDIVTCLEVLEHVPDPLSTIKACARLLRPGGDAFFSTINRNARAYLITVIGAEHVLGLLPKDTHDFDRFIRPSELDELGRAAGLELQALAGLGFDPAAGGFRLSADVGINYIAHFQRAARATSGV